MKKAYRINSHTYFKDEDFEKHLAFVRDNIDTIDEVAIFFEYCHHAYMPVKELTERCNVIRERIKAYRAVGIKSVGINVLNTIGQTEEAWDFMQPSPFQTMVGYEGFVSKACFCIASKEFEEYTRLKYKLIAETEPDFIWLDDDMRIKNHGSPFPCFCDNCLGIFNGKYGYDFDRESLVNALNSKDGAIVRSRWIDFNHEKLYKVARICEEVIHGINPSIITGLMCSDRECRWYSQCDPSTLLDELRGTKSRPGGGFYNDDCPTRIIDNIATVQRQAALFSEHVTDVQYEYETYPHLRLAKSDAFTNLEIVNAIMAGCNGIAFNTGHDRQNVADLLRRKRGLYDYISESAFRKKPIGVYTLYNGEYPKRKNVDGDFFVDKDWLYIYETTDAIAEIGIPLSGACEQSEVRILLGQMVDGYTDKELLELLSGRLMLDGYAANELIKRGFAEYIGVSSSKYYESGISEHYTNHPVNGVHDGHRRTIALTFFFKDYNVKSAAFAFKANKNAEIVSDLYSILDEKLGVCGTLFENSLGGIISVNGFAAFSFLRTEEKREQLLNIIDRMTDGKFPIRVGKPLRVMPLMRSDDKESIISLSNLWYDATESFPLEIRLENVTEILKISDDGRLIPTEYEKTENGVRISVDSISPWDCCVYTVKRS